MDEDRPPTTRQLYLADDHCYETRAVIVGLRPDAIAFDQSCFYPGGGGQPSDQGRITLADGTQFAVSSVQIDAGDVLWHRCQPSPPLSLLAQTATLTLNSARREILTRYHTVLHVLNTIALRDYGAWITGVQMAEDYSRIDFKWDGFSPAVREELERKVNAVLEAALPLCAYTIPEGEFRQREDLLRTLEVRPPVKEGHVRVVEIEGFDAQACGGTHVPTTAQVGRFSIRRTENKGKINKRFYIHLDDPGVT